eukprot:GABW01000612.1.p2 GENE.GABW01000612.1~~GABW01000612.1.p2  ORF type:complete len:54 (-),score=11.65 GABW01000612.1:86-247(-)
MTSAASTLLRVDTLAGVNTVCVSPDGSYSVASGGKDGKVMLWDLKSKTEPPRP